MSTDDATPALVTPFWTSSPNSSLSSIFRGLRWIRSTPLPEGMLSLAEFLKGWGLIFIVSTVLVGLLKSERVCPHQDDELTIGSAYLQVTGLSCNILSSHPLIPCRCGHTCRTRIKLGSASYPVHTC